MNNFLIKCVDCGQVKKNSIVKGLAQISKHFYSGVLLSFLTNCFNTGSIVSR